jgi:predicted nucleic acid-binding protein
VGAGYLFDTNILLRLTRRGDPSHTLIQHAVRQLLQQDASLYYCPQNIAELWNVLTRPMDRNGFGLTIRETEEEVRLIERHFTLLPDSDQIYPLWRRLVNEYVCKVSRSMTHALSPRCSSIGSPTCSL